MFSRVCNLAGCKCEDEDRYRACNLMSCKHGVSGIPILAIWPVSSTEAAMCASRCVLVSYAEGLSRKSIVGQQCLLSMKEFLI